MYLRDPSGKLLTRSNPALYRTITQGWPGLMHAVRYFAGRVGGEMQATGDSASFQIIIGPAANPPGLAIVVGGMHPLPSKRVALTIRLPNDQLEQAYWRSRHSSIGQRSRLQQYVSIEALRMLTNKSHRQREAVFALCFELGLTIAP